MHIIPQDKSRTTQRINMILFQSLNCNNSLQSEGVNRMGNCCSNSQNASSPIIVEIIESTEPIEPTIPAPEGEPIDILSSDHPIEDIVTNPHINYYTKEIINIINPLKKKSNGNRIKITRESYATARKQQYDRYTKTVNDALTENDESVTNVLAEMTQQFCHDDIDFRRLDNDKHKALKCFIYLYTGQYAYKKINSQLRNGEYQKMASIIGVVQKQLNEYYKSRFSKRLKVTEKYSRFVDLYRGINKPDPKIKVGSKLFWKGFTSTSLRQSVAERFGKFLYVISLDSKNPHPYIIVPQDLGKYDEEQIILFPFFNFECNNIENFTSTARYKCKQIQS